MAAGIVFKNFGSVREIGGLFTVEGFRRQHHALRIVEAALKSLIDQGRIPRYQVRSDNTPSIALARACGLREFLRMEHLRTDLPR